MAKSADIRPGITLACTECKERNYITTKNRRNTPDRLELKKFCPRCGKQTVPPRDSLIASITALQNPAHSAGFLRIASGGEWQGAESVSASREKRQKSRV